MRHRAAGRTGLGGLPGCGGPRSLGARRHADSGRHHAPVLPGGGARVAHGRLGRTITTSGRTGVAVSDGGSRPEKHEHGAKTGRAREAASHRALLNPGSGIRATSATRSISPSSTGTPARSPGTRGSPGPAPCHAARPDGARRRCLAPPRGQGSKLSMTHPPPGIVAGTHREPPPQPPAAPSAPPAPRTPTGTPSRTLTRLPAELLQSVAQGSARNLNQPLERTVQLQDQEDCGRNRQRTDE